MASEQASVLVGRECGARGPEPAGIAGEREREREREGERKTRGRESARREGGDRSGDRP